jgi:hypothetical protein
MSKLIPRAFGFDFRGSLLEGTLYWDENNNTDIHIFYKGEEFASMALFSGKYPMDKEEERGLVEKINKFIK